MADMPKESIFAERFKVIRRLAVGGMGIVYEAEQLGLDRRVALKIVHQGLLNTDELNARFEREARVLATLRHRNICLFYAYGTGDSLPADGQQGLVPYIAMELLSGWTLAEMLHRRGKLTLRDALDVVAQMADAVAHAHEHGVIHRDLKPANIFILDQDGSLLVKVSDFGLARLLDIPGANAQALTSAGFAVGTPAYMSPEQTRALPASPRSDIYSAGCILYECIFGEALFTGSSDVEIMQKHNLAPLPDFTSIPGLPAGVAETLSKALEKDPDNRYATMSEFAGAVRACLEQVPESRGDRALAVPVAAPLESPVGGGGIWTNRVVTGLAAFFLTLLAAFLFRESLVDSYCAKAESSHQRGQYKNMVTTALALDKWGFHTEARRCRKSAESLLAKESPENMDALDAKIWLAYADPAEFGKSNTRFAVAIHASVRRIVPTFEFSRLLNPQKCAFIERYVNYVESTPPQLAETESFAALDACIAQCIAMDEVSLHIRLARAKLALLRKRPGSEAECAMMRMMIVHLLVSSSRDAEALHFLDDGTTFVPSHLRNNAAPIFVAGEVDAVRIMLANGQKPRAVSEVNRVIESSALKDSPYSLAIFCFEAGALLGNRSMQQLALKYAAEPISTEPTDPAIFGLQQCLQVREILLQLHADATLLAKVEHDARRIGLELNADDLDLPYFKQVARNIGIDQAKKTALFMLTVHPSAVINRRLAYSSLSSLINVSGMDQDAGIPESAISRLVAGDLMPIRVNLEPHRLWSMDQMICLSYEFHGLWPELKQQAALILTYQMPDKNFQNVSRGHSFWWQAESEWMLGESAERCADLVSKAIPLLHASATTSFDTNCLTAVHCFYGRVLTEQGNLSAAETQFREGVAIGEKQDDFKDWSAIAQSDLAETLLLENRPQESRVQADAAVAKLRAATHKDARGSPIGWIHLAGIYEDLGCAPEALRCLEPVLLTAREGRGPADARLVQPATKIYRKHGLHAQARAFQSAQPAGADSLRSFAGPTIKELYRRGKSEHGAR